MAKVISKEGILVLEDKSRPEGLHFRGELFGSSIDVDRLLSLPFSGDRGYGEVVFNTSLTGYQEILTDPSYFGQMVCMTAAHIGNTGVNAEDPESRQAWAAGLILNEFSPTPSNWRAKGALEEYLLQYSIPGITGIDTRTLTRHLRSLGVVRGLILPATAEKHTKELLKKLPSFEGRDLIREVSTREAYRWKGTDSKKTFKVVAVDFGAKWNLLRELDRLGCEVDVVPATSTAADILARKPDGVFLSNGPGDPSAAPYARDAVRDLLGKVPIFGVCMGHQILSLAVGAKTFKMKFGHRGGNQPVKDQTTGCVEISSHNHGYAVDPRSLPARAKVTHLNLNDQTVEGIEIPDAKAFSVQYHPEACPGPHDSVALFDRFISLMKS